MKDHSEPRLRGEVGKQFAIKNLRAYANEHYPTVTTKSIPQSVLDLFKEKVTA